MIYFLIILLIFLRWFFNDKNFYTLNMYMGKMGCGKTTHIVKLAQKYIKKGYKVYCNFELCGTYLYDPTKMSTMTFDPNSIVFLDEIGLIFNNRQFAKTWNMGYTEFFKYMRQFQIQLHCYSQALDSDKVIRNLVHNLYLMQRIGKITIIRPISKNFGIATDQNGNGQIVDTYRFNWFFDWKFIYLPRYYGMFNSFNPPHRDIIKGVYQDYNDIQKIYTDTKKYIIFKIKMFFLRIGNIPRNLIKKIKKEIYED